MTLTKYQKDKIELFLKEHSQALFQQLCEKHKVDMNNLDDADPHGIYNLITDVRAALGECEPYQPSGEKKAEAKPTAPAPAKANPVISQSTFTPKFEQKPIKKLEDYLTDLRACYPDTGLVIQTSIIKEDEKACLTKCILNIARLERGDGSFVETFEAFGYAVKEEEGTGMQKKYMIPLSEARAVKRACRLATVGMKPQVENMPKK